MYNTDPTLAAAPMSSGFIVGLILAVIILAGHWKIFTKANQPGWAAICMSC